MVAIALLLMLLPIDVQINTPPESVGEPALTIGQDQITFTIGTEVSAAGVADYTCDGTDDNIQFQQALDALPANGGKLAVLAGEYSFSVAVSRAIDNVTIQGVGKATVISLADNTNANVSIFEATGRDGIAILDMLIDGNGRNQTSGKQYGVKFTDCTNVRVDCWIENFRSGDILVNNVKDVGNICNRNYCDGYTARTKLLLDIEGTAGWSMVESSVAIPTLSDSTDRIFGEKSLKITFANADDWIIIQHDMPVDLRFYPMFRLITKDGEEGGGSHYLPQITLVSSGGLEISTTETRGGSLDTYPGELDKFNQAIFSITEFDWTGVPHWILEDIVSIKLKITSRALKPTRTTYLDLLEAVRGLPRPLYTPCFDDGQATQFDNGLTAMSSLGMASVLALNTHRVGETIAGGSDWTTAEIGYAVPAIDRMTWDNVEKFYKAGWDIISHSASHYRAPADVDYGGESRKHWEWYACRAVIERKGFYRGSEFYAHAGSHPANKMNYVEKYFSAGRTPYLRGGAAGGGFLPYELPQCFIESSLPSVDDHLYFHLWATTCLHDISDIGVFKTTMQAYKDAGIEVIPFSEVYHRYPDQGHKPSISFEMKPYTDIFYNLAAAATDYIHTEIAGTGTLQTITAGFAHQPDYPRTISVTCTNVGSPSGDVYVYGKDARGFDMSQKVAIVAGGTAYTTAAFALVNKITVPVDVPTGDTITIGISDRLGLSHWILEYTDVTSIRRNGAEVEAAADLFVIKQGFVSWESTVDLTTVMTGDDVVISYETNM